jgi:uncharacterized protein (TIGR03382 family)
MTITATSSLGTGSFVVHLSDGTWTGDTWTWHSPTDAGWSYDIYDTTSGREIGAVTRLDCEMGGDPQANVTFGVMANNTLTHFSITSGLVSFAPINPASGRASASMTVTDLTGDGASAIGTGGFNYHAMYNGATPFANLLPGAVVAAPFSSNTANDAFPPVGFFPIAGPVSNMSSLYDFNLTANDSASGTSVYVIIPSPASGALLGLAGLAGLRRRRR